jgi:SAM-dependent methyltransferase
MKQFCDLGGFYGKDILEVGCGFGWDAVALALTGNNRVTASDILPSMIDGVSQCLSAMDARGKTLPVTAVQADICEVDFPDNSFDGIFTSEAIEHVHDLNRMFANCYRLLKPAGTALIVNDSNRYNGAACAHSWEGWTDRDESWEHVDWLKTEVRPVEHADAKPYGVMREEIIRSVAPDMAADDLARLRHATAGMIKPEIEAAVARFEAAGELPLRDEFGWCRNPETGEYSERLLDPFELRDMLRAVGFRVQLRHMFRKMPFKLLNGVAFRPLNERLFAMRPMFVLVAKKPDR